MSPCVTLLSLAPAGVRLLACKPSQDGKALVIRLHEAAGKRTRARMTVALPGDAGGGQDKRGHVPKVLIPLFLKPFEIKTIRVERDGAWRSVRLIEEQPA